MVAVGLDMDTIMADKAGAEEWITNIVSSGVAMLVLALLFKKMNVDSWLKGAGYGLLIGFSFVLLSTMSSNMFAKFPYELAWITAGFTTTGLAVGGAVLGVWKKYKK